MLRHRSGWILSALAVVSLVWFAPVRAAADFIACSPVPAPASSGSGVSAEGAAVADALRAQGLDESEISARLAQLAPEEVSALADSPQQIQMAGGTFILIGVIVALVVFGLLLYILD